MTFYQNHVFFCLNRRENGNCCGNEKNDTLREYAKQRCKELGIHQQGKVRINKGGCMGRCQEGAVMVIYPDAIWYRYQSKHDIDEIIHNHLQKGQPVKHLMI